MMLYRPSCILEKNEHSWLVMHLPLITITLTTYIIMNEGASIIGLTQAVIKVHVLIKWFTRIGS
jgi:hypothetical protein